MNIDTSLLREKFVIKEKTVSARHKRLTIIAPSTRMRIALQSGGLPTEDVIIRTNNMHSVTRMVAQIINNYEKHGPIMPRLHNIDWPDLWDHCLSPYERLYNPERWVSVYFKGKRIFQAGKTHSFLDVIEQCDALNKSSYEKSIKLAQDAFLKAGKDVDIDYDSNVALVAVIAPSNARCSLILRGPDKTTTFNYSIKPSGADHKINTAQGLSSAADFLEGMQLSYKIGFNTKKLELGLIQKASDEDKETRAARSRLNDISAQINGMENRYIVRYRPERPKFDLIIGETEKYFAKQLDPADANKI